MDMGVMTDAPIPCRTREAMRAPRLGDRAQATDPMTKRSRPMV